MTKNRAASISCLLLRSRLGEINFIVGLLIHLVFEGLGECPAQRSGQRPATEQTIAVNIDIFQIFS